MSRNGRLTCRAAICLWACACACWARPARVPADCRVSAGFDGVTGPAGSLFPVAVTIRNDVAGTTGRIELVQPDGSGSYEVTQTLPFTTPAPSTKRFVLYHRLEPDRGLEVRVEFADHLKPVRERVRLRPQNQPIVLCCGYPRACGFGEASRAYRFLSVGAGSLPDAPVGLDGVHGVLLSGAAFASLDAAQVRALREWTLTGGIAMLHDPAAGPAFERNMRAFGGPRFDADRPGLRFLGAGRFASSGTSPAPDQAFWELDAAMTAQLFPALDREEVRYYGREPSLLTDLWHTSRAGGVLGVLWVSAILGAYVLTIGPLDRWLVRRFRRPWLTWVFFLAAIALFSVVAYGYSRFVNVGTMRLVKIAVLDTAQGGDAGRGNASFWVYSAGNRTYDMRTPVEHAILSARESLLGAGAVARVEVRNGRAPALAARIPVFSAKQFDAAWYAGGAPEVVVEGEGPDLRVTCGEGPTPSAVMLADELGLTRFTRTAGGWVPSGPPAPWQDVVGSLVGSLRGGPHQPAYYRAARGREQDALLPSSRALQDYLLFVSFPWPVFQVRSEDLNRAVEDPGVARMLARRDARERALDARDRLKGGGRMLLLFLDEDDSPLLPLRFGWASPAQACVNLIRLQLPAAGAGEG